MRTIIAGSRSCVDDEILLTALSKCPWNIETIICGMAKGADELGRVYGKTNYIPVIPFRADWNQFGKAAGRFRNEEMAQNADACIVLWDGISTGSTHMIQMSMKYKLPLVIYKYLKNTFEFHNFAENTHATITFSTI